MVAINKGPNVACCHTDEEEYYIVFEDRQIGQALCVIYRWVMDPELKFSATDGVVMSYEIRRFLRDPG